MSDITFLSTRWPILASFAATVVLCAAIYRIRDPCIEPLCEDPSTYTFKRAFYWLLKLYFLTGYMEIFALSYRDRSSYGSCCDARTRSLPGRPHVRPLFAVCLSVCLSVCVCTWSIVWPRPYVYIVGLHLPQGAPAYVGSYNA